MGNVNAYTNPAGEVSFRDPTTGNYVWVPKDKAQQAANEGLVPESYDAGVKRVELKADDAVDAFITRGLGALTLADTLSSGDDKLDKRFKAKLAAQAEQSPIASTLGNVGGTLGGLFLSGGAKAAGAIAAKAAAKEGAKRLAVQSSIEGAMLGAHGNVRKQLNSGKDFSAAEFATDVAKSAALGGALSLSLSGIVASAKYAGTKAKSLAERAGQKIKGAKKADNQATGASISELSTKKAALESDLATLKRLGGDNVLAVEKRVYELEQAVKRASKARTASYKASHVPVKGYATPHQVARLREMSRNSLYTGGMKKTIEDALIKPTTSSVRSAFTKIRKIEKATPRMMAKEPEFIGKGLGKFVDSARRRVKDPRISSTAKKELDDILARTSQATEKTAIKQLKQDYATLLGKVDDELGLPALTTEANAYLQTFRKGARAQAAESTQAVKSITQDLDAAKLELQNALGGWQPSSGIPIHRLSSELKKTTEAISQGRQAAFSAVGDMVSQTRNVLAFGGGLAAQSWLVGLAGYAAPTLLRSSTLANAGVKVAGGIARASTASAPIAKLATIELLNQDQLRNIHQSLNQADGDQIYKDTQLGAKEGGASDDDAKALAQFTAGRIDLLKQNLPVGKTAVNRRQASELIAAANNPQSIMARVKRNELTKSDMLVLNQLMPQLAQQLQQEAQAIIASDQEPKNQKAKRTIEQLAQGAIYSQTYGLLSQARGQEQAANSRRTRKQFKSTGLSTPMQRMQMGLGSKV